MRAKSRSYRSKQTPKRADFGLTTGRRAALLILGASLAIGFLAWLCVRDPKINFLPRDGRAEWILFPYAVESTAHGNVSMDTFFRRSFTLENQPRVGRLYLRAANRFEVKINGNRVEPARGKTWKWISSADVLPFLRSGTNSIDIRVFNEQAPPALWLVLETDASTLRSDAAWEASMAGSAYRGVALASVPRIPRPGNLIYTGEKTYASVAKVWPVWVIFGVIAFGISAASSWWFNRVRTPDATGSVRISGRQAAILLLVFSAFWLALFWNNVRLFPFPGGFDFTEHLDYIKYLQERRALPLPTEGYEMFQPPLYYLLSAVTLSLCGLSIVDAPSGILVLRGLTMLFGVAHFVFVFLSLRRLFPNSFSRQAIGLVLAAFLSMQLYLSHYPTNETLAAALISAGVYFALRVLQTESGSLMSHVWLGLCLGAAMLTKFTGILLLPPLLLVLAIRLAMGRSSIAIWLRNVVVMLAVCFIVAGWHYIRIWLHFGTPLLGNWDVASGFAWWQDPGYRMTADYLRFGRSLVSPLFSGFAGVPDGIHSTLWGDGLCGGVPKLAYRPPWNYDLMIAGYLLAIVPTILILIGAAMAIWRLAQKPSAECFLLVALSAAVILGGALMTLKVASYAQVKAFYGLSILVPLCYFGAAGWGALTFRRKTAQLALGTVLLVWAMNSFASVWIRDSVSQKVYTAVRKPDDAGVAKAIEAVSSDPLDENAMLLLTFFLDELGRPNDSLQLAEKGRGSTTAGYIYHLQLAKSLVRQGEIERAIEENRRAIELAPESLPAYEHLLFCLLKTQQNDDAIKVASDGLAVFPFKAPLHNTLGVALARKGEFVMAANHFAYSLLLYPTESEPSRNLRQAIASIENDTKGLREAAMAAPDLPILLDTYAWLLATHEKETLRNGQDAVRLAERACAVTNRKTAMLLNTLAAAYAETGRFPEAINTAHEALFLAQLDGDANAVALSKSLLVSFAANLPFRDNTQANAAPSP